MAQKTLIAVVTCRARLNTWSKAVRDTWLTWVPKDKADVLFFVGRGEPMDMPSGVVELDCEDAYGGLPDKVRSIVRYAKQAEYEFMLKCDDDVILKPSALLASGYELHDYMGRANRPPQPYVVPMGFNYWLSKRSMSYIVDSPLPPDNDDEKWVAGKLWEHGIKLRDDRRYFLHTFKYDHVTDARRPLRAPRRDRVSPPDEEALGFSWCIHIAAEQHEKIAEFYKVFERHVQGA